MTSWEIWTDVQKSTDGTRRNVRMVCSPSGWPQALMLVPYQAILNPCCFNVDIILRREEGLPSRSGLFHLHEMVDRAAVALPVSYQPVHL